MSATDAVDAWSITTGSAGVVIADRVRQHVNPRVSAAGWRVYDRYLKANRVEAGTASYAEVVRLALGVRFGPDWTPLRK